MPNTTKYDPKGEKFYEIRCLCFQDSLGWISRVVMNGHLYAQGI